MTDKERLDYLIGVLSPSWALAVLERTMHNNPVVVMGIDYAKGCEPDTDRDSANVMYTARILKATRLNESLTRQLAEERKEHQKTLQIMATSEELVSALKAENIKKADKFEAVCNELGELLVAHEKLLKTYSSSFDTHPEARKGFGKELPLPEIRHRLIALEKQTKLAVGKAGKEGRDGRDAPLWMTTLVGAIAVVALWYSL